MKYKFKSKKKGSGLIKPIIISVLLYIIFTMLTGYILYKTDISVSNYFYIMLGVNLFCTLVTGALYAAKWKYKGIISGLLAGLEITAFNLIGTVASGGSIFTYKFVAVCLCLIVSAISGAVFTKNLR